MTRVMLLFDGLCDSDSAPVIASLRELRRDRPDNSALIDVLCEAVNRTVVHLGPRACNSIFPDGVPLRSWIVGTALLDSRLRSNSVVAGIANHAYQLCQLQSAMPLIGKSDTVVGAVGHSLGLQSAIVASLGWARPDQLQAVAAWSMRLVANCLIRAADFGLRRPADPSMVRRYAISAPDRPRPGPMASVRGVARVELEALVAAHNAKHSGGTGQHEIELALVNSPSFLVLVGDTTRLIQFYFEAQERLTAAGAAWTFMASAAPFHSAVLRSTARSVGEDTQFIGDAVTGDQLDWPVFATDSPRSLRDAKDLAVEFASLSLARHLDWPSVMSHAVCELGVERVVDFGPGACARVFTRDLLRSMHKRPEFVSVRRLAPAGSG